MRRFFASALVVLILLGTNSADINAYSSNVDEIQQSTVASTKRIITPAYLTMYDFATEGDLYYSHLTSKLVQDTDPENWGIFEGVKKTLGKPIAELFEAKKIVALINETFPLANQDAAKPINDLVVECAQILGVKTPEVFVRGNNEPTAYIIDIDGKYSLVLTSKLLELYGSTPNQLKFIIGHELGHAKANHLQSYQVSRAILQSLEGAALIGRLTKHPVGQSLIALPPLAFGFFLTWSREAEITADRAGLLCCQDIKVATQALMRLSHWISPNAPILNPDSPEFDPEELVISLEKWEEKPFVEFLSRLQEGSATHPFIRERVAAIMTWEKTDGYKQILERQSIPGEKQILSFQQIAIKGLGTNEGKENPYIKVYYNNQEIFQSEKLSKTSNPEWGNLNQEIEYLAGCPIFIEVWDIGRIGGWAGTVGGLWDRLKPVENVSDWTETRLVIGMFYPQKGKSEYILELRHSDDRPDILSKTLATVIVEVK